MSIHNPRQPLALSVQPSGVAMSDDAMRAHLAAALKIAVEKERVRVDTLLADMDDRIQGDVDAMRPVIEALTALAEECREIPGLSIRPAPHGHMAVIDGRERYGSHHLRVDPAGSWGFRIEESGSGPPEPYEMTETVVGPAEAIQKVIEFIARHTDSVRRHPPGTHS